MVCAPDHLAAGAGLVALRAGGSAADAAVAAAAVLAVTFEHMCGLGGDLLAVVHRAGEKRPAALNASGRAGSGADAARLRSEGHDNFPATGDVRAVTIPGCVDGWIALHARFGRLELGELLEPGRRLAQDGFPLSPRVAEVVPAIAERPWAADYLAAGPPRPGAVVRRPGLARALAAIAADGRAAFYGGEFGAGLLELGAGEYAPEDLAVSQADWVDPVGCDAWGRRLWTTPPNSQGYAALGAAWIAAGLDLPAPGEGEWARLLAQTAYAALADRDEVLHDRADGQALLAPERLEPLRAAVANGRAAIGAAAASGGDTISLTAVDSEGLAVSLIQSHYGVWGSQLAVPGTGVVLHNRGSGFSLRAGHPAEYGPGRRPPHTLSPMAITRATGPSTRCSPPGAAAHSPRSCSSCSPARWPPGRSPAPRSPRRASSSPRRARSRSRTPRRRRGGARSRPPATAWSTTPLGRRVRRGAHDRRARRDPGGSGRPAHAERGDGRGLGRSGSTSTTGIEGWVLRGLGHLRRI